MITINDLNYTIHDVAFEGFVFNCYGNFGNSSVFAYLHADITNQCRISTMNVTVGGALVTLHGDKFICRNQMQIKQIILKPRAKWEQGTSMFVFVLVVWLWWMFSCMRTSLFILFALNTIASFHKFLHDKFAMATIVVLVIGVHGEIKWTTLII